MMCVLSSTVSLTLCRDHSGADVPAPLIRGFQPSLERDWICNHVLKRVCRQRPEGEVERSPQLQRRSIKATCCPGSPPEPPHSCNS